MRASLFRQGPGLALTFVFACGLASSARAIESQDEQSTLDRRWEEAIERICLIPRNQVRHPEALLPELPLKEVLAVTVDVRDSSQDDWRRLLEYQVEGGRLLHLKVHDAIEGLIRDETRSYSDRLLESQVVVDHGVTTSRRFSRTTDRRLESVTVERSDERLRYAIALTWADSGDEALLRLSGTARTETGLDAGNYILRLDRNARAIHLQRVDNQGGERSLIWTRTYDDLGRLLSYDYGPGEEAKSTRWIRSSEPGCTISRCTAVDGTPLGTARECRGADAFPRIVEHLSRAGPFPAGGEHPKSFGLSLTYYGHDDLPVRHVRMGESACYELTYEYVKDARGTVVLVTSTKRGASFVEKVNGQARLNVTYED